MSPEELRKSIAATFALSEAAVVGEYGMTELSSQLYEGDAARGARARIVREARGLRPSAVDASRTVHPATLAPVAPGELGILRFEDLANVDGALVVQTADQGRVTELGVELLGRAPGAYRAGVRSPSTSCCRDCGHDCVARRAGEAGHGPAGGRAPSRGCARPAGH